MRGEAQLYAWPANSGPCVENLLCGTPHPQHLSGLKARDIPPSTALAISKTTALRTSEDRSLPHECAWEASSRRHDGSCVSYWAGHLEILLEKRFSIRKSHYTKERGLLLLQEFWFPPHSTNMYWVPMCWVGQSQLKLVSNDHRGPRG